MIREAEGKAQAIEAVQKATAQGIQYLNEGNANQSGTDIEEFGGL